MDRINDNRIDKFYMEFSMEWMGSYKWNRMDGIAENSNDLKE